VINRFSFVKIKSSHYTIRTNNTSKWFNKFRVLHHLISQTLIFLEIVRPSHIRGVENGSWASPKINGTGNYDRLAPET